MTTPKPKAKRKHVRTRPLAAAPAKVPQPAETIPLPVNVLFPGRENYTGPQRGYFAMLHHEILFETAEFQGVSERVGYVKRDKPLHERVVRLHNMMFVGDCPSIKALVALEDLAKVTREKYLSQDYSVGSEVSSSLSYAIMETKQRIRGEVLAYIRRHMPDHSWDEKNRPDERRYYYGKIKGT